MKIAVSRVAPGIFFWVGGLICLIEGLRYGQQSIELTSCSPLWPFPGAIPVLLQRNRKLVSCFQNASY